MTGELVGTVPGTSTGPDRGEPGVPLLEVRDLQVSFRLERNTIYAVQGLSLQVRAGERVGVVGESGSGKSVSALSVMRMVPSPGRITGGQIVFEGRDLLRLSPAAMRHIRGGQVGMIPQNPLTSLNPVITIESHFQEVLSLHLGLNKHQARERASRAAPLGGHPAPGDAHPRVPAPPEWRPTPTGDHSPRHGLPTSAADRRRTDDRARRDDPGTNP